MPYLLTYFTCLHIKAECSLCHRPIVVFEKLVLELYGREILGSHLVPKTEVFHNFTHFFQAKE
jgi:hypothetical protein